MLTAPAPSRPPSLAALPYPPTACAAASCAVLILLNLELPKVNAAASFALLDIWNIAQIFFVASSADKPAAIN